jgi:hypothetical protein
MRLAVKRAEKQQLNWSVLEIEPDEWDRRMASLDVAAAANGFPVFRTGPTGHRVDQAHGAASVRDNHLRRHSHCRRYLLFAALAVLFLAAITGFIVWRTADAGIDQMTADVANVVKLEIVRQRAGGPAALDGEIQSLEFLNGAAMASVAVTRTLTSGTTVVRLETHFYKQTAAGWQQTQAAADFWGADQTLDTQGLHFVFGSIDRAAVVEVAPTADAVYANLRRLTGGDLAPGGLLTIRIVPQWLAFDGGLVGRSVQLSSPLLIVDDSQRSKDVLLLLTMRRTLVQGLVDSARQKSAKPQWRPMVDAFRAWLQFADNAQLGPDSELAVLARLRWSAASPMDLAELLDRNVGYSPSLVSRQSHEEKRRTAAAQLLDYITTTWGTGVLPKLLDGFGRYDSWKTLAPAVLGVSADELEKGWRASAAAAAAR